MRTPAREVNETNGSITYHLQKRSDYYIYFSPLPQRYSALYKRLRIEADWAN